MEGNAMLPPELYGEIISHITNRRDLVSLSLVSRTLQYEAESSLWRKVTIESYPEPLGHLSVLPRVARHIHSLTISVGDLSIVDLLHGTLQATINLKSLEVSCIKERVVAGTKWHLGYLCQGTTFKLHQLLWKRLPITPSCELFFCNQTELVYLECSTEPQFFYDAFTSPHALPALKSVMTKQGHVLDALLPGRNVTHLVWVMKPDKLKPVGGPFSTIESLLIIIAGGSPSTSSTNLSSTFPNLQSFITFDMEEPAITDVVRGFSLLKEAKIFYPLEKESYRFSAQIATQLYLSNDTLENVEILYSTEVGQRFRGWLLKRGCGSDEPDPSAKALMIELSGVDTWKRWWGSL